MGRRRFLFVLFLVAAVLWGISPKAFSKTEGSVPALKITFLDGEEMVLRDWTFQYCVGQLNGVYVNKPHCFTWNKLRLEQSGYERGLDYVYDIELRANKIKTFTLKWVEKREYNKRKWFILQNFKAELTSQEEIDLFDAEIPEAFVKNQLEANKPPDGIKKILRKWSKCLDKIKLVGNGTMGKKRGKFQGLLFWPKHCPNLASPSQTLEKEQAISKISVID